MGWAGGSELAEGLWTLVSPYIPEQDRETIARQFINEFENMNCDTIYECERLVKDAGLEAEYWSDENE